MVDVTHELQTPTGSISINGSYDPRFDGVFKEFEQNFAERGEVDAGVCVTLQGATVVDLWGGVADAESRTPWTDKTMPIVWSSTKGATSICLHTLAYRGELDLDAPVSEYWPEYGVEDKASTTVKMFLNHTAGLPAIKEPVPANAFYDWPGVIKILEDAELWWAPGTEQGYHALTKGFLCGEILRRVTGQTIGEFLQQEFSGPLGLDFFMGLPDDRMDDAATMKSTRSLVVLELKFTSAVPSWMVNMVASLNLNRLAFSKYGTSVIAWYTRPDLRESMMERLLA